MQGYFTKPFVLPYLGFKTTPKAKIYHNAHFSVDKPNRKELYEPSQIILNVEHMTYLGIYING